MSDQDKVLALEARVHNLEIAMHALIAIISDTLPVSEFADVQRMASNHFDASTKIGGFTSVEFIEATA